MSNQQITEVRNQLLQLSQEIAKVLPEHVTPERFERITMTAIQRNPDLLTCSRKSLLESVMQCAQDGLIPDGREAALTKFKGNVAYMPMVAGILKKVRQSGEIATMTSRVVYEADEFDYFIDDEGEHMKHVPALGGDTGKPVLVYAMARTNDSAVYIEVLTLADIEKIRKASAAKNGGPWFDWWDEMAKKSAYRRLAKRLPMSTDLERVIMRDDQFYEFDNRKRVTKAASVMDKVKEKDITPPSYAEIVDMINNAQTLDEAKAAESMAGHLPEKQQAEIYDIICSKFEV